MTTVEVPDELLLLLKDSRLATRPLQEQVRIALAIHLFQEGLISVGRAAELSGVPRVPFELLMAEVGVPSVRYDMDMLEQDRKSLREAGGA